MDEILPGVAHWSAIHDNTGLRSHSYFHMESGTLIDPMVPDDGFGWFERHEPRRVLLTNRHHLRAAPEFASTFGIAIFCHPAGLYEFENGPDVQPMEPGDEPAPGIAVLEFGAITPEEVVLKIDAGPGALAFADGLIRVRDGSLGFVPDSLLGDDPEAVKRDLHAALARVLAEQEFDALLLAHGKPRASGGRAELKRFA
jgi:Metallo-beta-lactamase superfamily